MDDFYKTCRWCHWYNNGRCEHGSTFSADTVKAECAIDEGAIFEAVKEAFSDKDFPILRANLESSLSKKKAKQFYADFLNELENAQRDWAMSIDGAVGSAINLKLEIGNGISVELADPNTFCCKYFE